MLGSPNAGHDLRRWAAQFEGAWPYLTLIAVATGIGDPLDPRVVEAYWIGNDLLSRVPLLDFGNSLRDRFRMRNPVGWPKLADHLTAGAVPHHSFHIFCVYPWVGLLRTGPTGVALEVLDRCRIRVGQVVSTDDEMALVETTNLSYSGGKLAIAAAPVTIPFQRSLAPCDAGDQVAVHWNWVCAPISDDQAVRLRRLEARHLSLANSAHLVS